MKIKRFTIPNIITLLNLLSGTVGVIILFTHDNPAVAFALAFGCMIISAVLDFLDGFTARMLKSYSAIGVQLDSLADMVSFGLLPALVMFRMHSVAAGHYSVWGLLTLVIAACSALRLAKFNIDESQTDEFEGLPTPANALLIGSLGYVFGHYIYLMPMADGYADAGAEFGWLHWAVIGVSFVSAWLLISPIRMFSFKFKNFGWKGNELRYIFLGASLILLLLFGLSGVWITILTYILISVFCGVVCRPKEEKNRVVKK